MISVVTTFSQKGYDVYGRRMVESFAAYWPKDIPFYVYHEGEKPADASERAIWKPLDDDIDRQKFIVEHIDTNPRDYRTCAVRFCHKVFAMTGAPRDCDHLIYIDGDCETFAPVSMEMVASVCAGREQVGSYLARHYWNHTETGFLSFQINNGGDDFLDAFRAVYTSKELFKLSELHDCMAFDLVRRRFERQGRRFKNLCPTARGLDVFEHSPLKDFITHNKGPARKLKEYGDTMQGNPLEALPPAR